MSEFFYRLTPDWVLRAVEAAGLRPTGHCTVLNSLENRVYDLRLEDGSHVVAKFYRPERWSREAILAEHGFLAELAEAEIPICAPITFADGDTLHEVESILYAVWPRTGGRAADELTDTQVQVLGRLLARIHNVGATREAPGRGRLDEASHILEPLAFLEEQAFLPPSCAERYRGAALEVARVYAERSQDTPVHRIHGDCHLGNLLHGDAGWFFLDFDDFRIGPAVQDVWMLIPGRDAEGARQRSLMIEAYRQFRPFEDGWMRLVEPLRAMRFVHYAAWIARRWKDPAFPPTFPHFGTEDYWTQETRDLVEQVEILDGAVRDAEAGSSGKEEPEPELSNKDFFWDL